MGNISSNHLLRRSDEIDWEEYKQEPWRSVRAREMDHYGGFTRPAVERGRSVTARLMLLEGAVNEQGTEIEKELYKRWWDAKDTKNASKLVGHGAPLDTYLYHQPQRPVSKGQLAVNASTRKRERPQKPKELPPGSSTFKQQQQAIKVPPSTLEQQLQATDALGFGADAAAPDAALVPPQMLEPVPCTTVVNCHTGAVVPVANWRLHLHAARRRIILKVLTIIRLQRGLEAPLRMRRVDEWGWVIPGVLGNERLPRFVEDQRQLIQLRGHLKLLKSSFDALQRQLRADYQILTQEASAVSKSSPPLPPPEPPSEQGTGKGNTEIRGGATELEANTASNHRGRDAEGGEATQRSAGGSEGEAGAGSNGEPSPSTEGVCAGEEGADMQAGLSGDDKGEEASPDAPASPEIGAQSGRKKSGSKGSKKHGKKGRTLSPGKGGAAAESRELAVSSTLPRRAQQAQQVEHSTRHVGGNMAQSKAARSGATEQGAAAGVATEAARSEQDEVMQSLQMLLRVEQLLEGGPDVKLEETAEMGLAVDMPAPPPNLLSNGASATSLPQHSQQNLGLDQQQGQQKPTSHSAPMQTVSPGLPASVVPFAPPPFLQSQQSNPASQLQPLSHAPPAPGLSSRPPLHPSPLDPLQQPFQHVQNTRIPNSGPSHPNPAAAAALEDPEYTLKSTPSGRLLLPPVEDSSSARLPQSTAPQLPMGVLSRPPPGPPRTSNTSRAGTSKSSLQSSILPLVSRPSQDGIKVADTSSSPLPHEQQQQQQQQQLSSPQSLFARNTYPGPNSMLSMLSLMSQNSKLFKKGTGLQGGSDTEGGADRDIASPAATTTTNSLTPTGPSLLASFNPWSSSVPGLPTSSNTRQILSRGRSRMAAARREALVEPPKGHEPHMIEPRAYSDSYNGEMRRRMTDTDGLSKPSLSLDGSPIPGARPPSGRFLHSMSSLQQQQLRMHAAQQQQQQQQQQPGASDGHQGFGGGQGLHIAAEDHKSVVLLGNGGHVVTGSRTGGGVTEGMQGGVGLSQVAVAEGLSNGRKSKEGSPRRGVRKLVPSESMLGSLGPRPVAVAEGTEAGKSREGSAKRASGPLAEGIEGDVVDLAAVNLNGGAGTGGLASFQHFSTQQQAQQQQERQQQQQEQQQQQQQVRQQQQRPSHLHGPADEECWLQDEQQNQQQQTPSVREKLQMLKQGIVPRGSGAALGLTTPNFRKANGAHASQEASAPPFQPHSSKHSFQPTPPASANGSPERAFHHRHRQSRVSTADFKDESLNADEQATLARIEEIRARQARMAQFSDSDLEEEGRRKPAALKGRINQLQKLSNQLQQCQDSLSAAEHRLHMHVNRSNSAWADQHTWVPPDIWGADEMDSWKRSPAGFEFREAALACLKSGQVAFHFNAFEDMFERKDSGAQNLWCSDPWDLLLSCTPGMGAGPGHAKHAHLMWGSRAIAALVQSIGAAVGQKHAQEAVSQAWVIIALDDQIEQSVLKDLWTRKFYGLNRERVMFVLQTRRPAFAYNSSRQQFVSDELSSSHPPGTGLTFMQLAWSCEAYTLGKDGAPVPVQGTVLELLTEHNVQWLLSRRARDMGIISDTGALSLDSLAYAIFMREKARAGAIIEVTYEEGDQSLQASKTMDSIVLSNRAIHVLWRKTIKPSLMDLLPLNGMKTVVELSHAELRGGHSGLGAGQLLRELRNAMGNRVAIGCGRYTYHVPALKATLTTPALFRPKLCLMSKGERMGVQLDARDVLASPSVRSMGMLASRNEWRGALLGPQSMDVLLQLLQEQDTSPQLRKMVPGLRPPGQLVAPLRATTPAAAQRPGDIARPHPFQQQLQHNQPQTIVVFVTGNRVSQIAVDAAIALAMPGRDNLRLVTLLPSESPDLRAEAEDNMAKLYRSMLRTHGGGVGMGVANSPAVIDIVVRGDSSLIDCMENYLLTHGAVLAVLGSERLTQGTGVGSVIGSVALSFLRRVPTPTVLVTNNSFKLVSPKSEASKLGEQAAGYQGRVQGSSSSSNASSNPSPADNTGPQLRLGVVVEPTATHMHSFMCQRVASSKRRDQIFLLQPILPDPSINMLNHMRRVMGQFVGATNTYSVELQRSMQVEGVMDTVVPPVAEQCGINVLGVALTGHALPLHMLNLMRNYRGAVLVHRVRPSG